MGCCWGTGWGWFMLVHLGYKKGFIQQGPAKVFLFAFYKNNFIELEFTYYTYYSTPFEVYRLMGFQYVYRNVQSLTVLGHSVIL